MNVTALIKSFTSTALILLIFSSLCCRQKAGAVKHPTKFGITVSFNDDWKVEKSYSEDVFLLLLSTDENKRISFKENIKMVREQQDPPIDFMTMVEKNRAYATANKIPLLEQEITKIDGKDAFRVVYMLEENGEQQKSLQFLQSFNGNFYSLTFSARVAKFDAYEKHAEEILRSVRY